MGIATVAAKFNSILVSNDPRGRRFGGIVDGTPKPGTVMQVKANTTPVNGKYTFEVYNRDSDGDRPRGPIIVLLEDYLQGRTITDAYVSGTLGQFYIPLPGDELVMIIGDVSGTGDTHALGEILMVDDGTGELVATTGSIEAEPFILMEAISTAPTEDTWAYTWFAG